MKRPYRIVLENAGRPCDWADKYWFWTLISPNGVAVATSLRPVRSKSAIRRAARNLVLAMCSQPVIIEEKP